MLILQVCFFHPIGHNGWHLSCLTKKIGPQRLTHCRCHTLVCVWVCVRVAWLSIFACWFYFQQCFILPEPHTSEIKQSSLKFSLFLLFLGLLDFLKRLTAACMWQSLYLLLWDFNLHATAVTGYIARSTHSELPPCLTNSEYVNQL